MCPVKYQQFPHYYPHYLTSNVCSVDYFFSLLWTQYPSVEVAWIQYNLKTLLNLAVEPSDQLRSTEIDRIKGFSGHLFRKSSTKWGSFTALSQFNTRSRLRNYRPSRCYLSFIYYLRFLHYFTS